MSDSVDRARIMELLRDETLSFRAISREVGCSDWTVRAIARELAGDARPMKRARCKYQNDCPEPLGLAGWGIFVGIVAAFAIAFWFGTRGISPPEM